MSIIEFSWERTLSHPSCVSLRYPNHSLYFIGSNSESSAHTSDRSRRGCYVRICSKINIKKSSISSLSQNSFARFHFFVDPAHRLYDHIFLKQDISISLKLSQLRGFFLLIIELRHSFVFCLECIPMKKISHSQTKSVNLGSISWSDSLLGGSQKESLFICAIFFNLIFGDQVSSI